jgi:thiopurine S-methyltransferase
MTVDIDWLLSRGHQVAGAELSNVAVAQLFARLGLRPTVHRGKGIERHSAAGLDVFVGDIFDLPVSLLGEVDAVYDRAALVALPAQMRPRYVRQLGLLAGDVAQLLITLEYDQSEVDGPPFSVPASEVHGYHPGGAAVLLHSTSHPLGLKGRFPVVESAWKIN